MVAYLATDLTSIDKELRALILKPEVVESNKSVAKLASVDVEKKENQVSI